ncbi:uncharacterized protein K460DRAFT_419170 [Cucurbitaria berberidis CBS 394.84]|uniref:Uncharacterized protein n=1 Tax=Cucurbitaria berberidis CBS 394.84 TaxID=1168544 RepID=A0A9P4GEZ7_9PLEO|nr:uncharacterized protein K460DRAFT_419170 [Cucurbitaria berberidis CBS 394.84]KAF1844229.1 hypothetical protein K460DRAFT_419170 [Cucurbitaria berberidis CBS 394.84]
MGNSFGFLRTQSKGGFQFTVLNACKAEGIDLNQTCSLTFSPSHELVSIGNVTRGEMKPEPGIAGIGMWFAMILFFGVVVIALIFVVLEVMSRSSVPSLAYFKDSPVSNPDDPNSKRGKRDLFRAAGRTFVLGVSDTQTIFVGAFLLSFAGQSKCRLTSYHFTVAINQMMIALSVMTFSVALVRTYWRNPLAAAFRLLLSVGSFIGVGLTIFREANYAPDWPPPSSRKDSAILLPVACLLESDLKSRAQEQAEQNQAELGFGGSSALPGPTERYFFIILIIAFILAHASIIVRFLENKDHAPEQWTRYRGWFTVVYWPWMLIPPTFTSVWCWVRVYETREWVKNSGWIAFPNPEMIIWDSGQLIAMGVLITVMMNMLTEAYKREQKGAQRNDGARFQRLRSVEGVDSRFEEDQSDSYPMARTYNAGASS